MATSGTYVEARTALQVIDDALFELGVQDADGSASASEITRAIRAFNDVIFQIKGPPTNFTGFKLWQVGAADVTPVEDTILHELKPTGGQADIQVPEEILSCVLRETATNIDKPMTWIDYVDHAAIREKYTTGSPSRYTYKKLPATGYLYVYPVPTAVIAAGYTLTIEYRFPIEIITAGANELDFPNPWYRALKWLLARELSPAFNIGAFATMSAAAQEAVDLAGSFDEEQVSAFFEPNRII